LQPHRVEADTVENWRVIPAYAQALEKALGPRGAQTLSTACDEHLNAFNELAERIYINWLQTAAQV